MNLSSVKEVVAGVRARFFAINPLAYTHRPSMTEDELLQAWIVYEKILVLVPYNEKEQKKILTAMVVTFFGHLFAEHRKSGEPYFYHLFRCGLKVLHLQKKLKIKDVDAVVAGLLHDVIEEAEKSDLLLVPYLLFLTKSIVIYHFDDKVATIVHWLSRQKWKNEGRVEHLERICLSDLYEVLLDKLIDILDNFDTLKSMPIEKQLSKFVEAKLMLEKLLDRLDFLVERGIENGTLIGEGWSRLLPEVKKDLLKSIRKQKERLAKAGVEVE